MGVSGVPSTITDQEIIDAFKKFKGLVKYAAESLGCTFQHVYDRMKQNPKLKEELDKAREAGKYEKLDSAEQKLQDLMNLPDDPGIAFKSVQYYLNNQGKERGYNHPEALKQASLSEIEDWIKKGSNDSGRASS